MKKIYSYSFTFKLLIFKTHITENPYNYYITKFLRDSIYIYMYKQFSVHLKENLIVLKNCIVTFKNKLRVVPCN